MHCTPVAIQAARRPACFAKCTFQLHCILRNASIALTTGPGAGYAIDTAGITAPMRCVTTLNLTNGGRWRGVGGEDGAVANLRQSAACPRRRMCTRMVQHMHLRGVCFIAL